MERRITTISGRLDETQRLKHVAGLLDNLSYREMRFFIGVLNGHRAESTSLGPESTGEALLATIQTLLELKELPK